jgi:hypothetical protein
LLEVNGKPFSLAEEEILIPAEGDLEIKVFRPGYEVFQRQVRVSPGKRQKVEIWWQPTAWVFDVPQGRMRRFGPVTQQTEQVGIEVWVRATQTEYRNRTVVVFHGDSRTQGMGIYRFGSRYVGAVNENSLIGEAHVELRWMHLALVKFRGGAVHFYSNGKLMGEGRDVKPPPFTTSTGSFVVGEGSVPSEQLAGEVSKVRVFTFRDRPFSIDLLELLDDPPN